MQEAIDELRDYQAKLRARGYLLHAMVVGRCVALLQRRAAGR